MENDDIYIYRQKVLANIVNVEANIVNVGANIVNVEANIVNVEGKHCQC